MVEAVEEVAALSVQGAGRLVSDTPKERSQRRTEPVGPAAEAVHTAAKVKGQRQRQRLVLESWDILQTDIHVERAA